MADLSITVAQVLPGSDKTKIKLYQAGAVITQGQAVYYDSTTSTVKLSQADGTAAEAKCIGVAVGGAAVANQWIGVQTGGTWTVGAGAAVAAGTPYFVSGTAGGICLDADIAASSFVVYIGTSNGSNQIVMPADGPTSSGVEHA